MSGRSHLKARSTVRWPGSTIWWRWESAPSSSCPWPSSPVGAIGATTVSSPSPYRTPTAAPRAAAIRRRLPRPGARRDPRRRLQPPRVPRATFWPHSVHTSPTVTGRRGARRSTSTEPTPTTCARYFLHNARQWFTEFHIDGLRLDAVHEIIDRSAIPFLSELATARRRTSAAGSSWRRAPTTTRVSSPRSAAGGLGMDAQWNDDFHHAVHAAITGERTGYYLDFGPVSDIAAGDGRGLRLPG